MGASLVVNADLVDGRSGFLKFSNVYDTVEDALLDTQERVANDVRTSIRGAQAPELRTTSRPASYDVLNLFWRGDYEFAKRSRASIHEAISLFEQTIELDPGYGPAYLKLAHATALLPDYSDEPREQAYDRALRIAARGAKMDSSMEAPRAAIVGFVHHKRGNWIAAQKAYEAALDGYSDFGEIHHLYSRLLASVGRLDASLEQAQLARADEPNRGVLISRLAISYYWMNDLENAEKHFKLAEQQPDFELPNNGFAYALLLIRKGEMEKAVQFASAALQSLGLNDSWVEPVFGGLHGSETQDAALNVVVELSEAQALPPVVQITLWTLFGQLDRAMEVARLLETQGEIFEAEILFSEDFRVLREHPDFLPLMEATGIADYWDSVGCRWQNNAVVCDEMTTI